ncbi:MAG: AbrB/MazE/SpoVT family DNA-binding domain-containing protein [Pseudomonadota bacterium]|nr:AbrB/MazE/SpoVT family DNA-binding domain-containing protein [Pseudomonadota bacterium]
MLTASLLRAAGRSAGLTETNASLKTSTTVEKIAGSFAGLQQTSNAANFLALPYLVSRDSIGSPKAQGMPMSTLLVSSKGQIVLPAEMRRRLGLGAGARLEVLEEADGLKLRVVRSVKSANVSSLAGMIKAPTLNIPRKLENFDPATLLVRTRRERR